jgi:hypothetical protein
LPNVNVLQKDATEKHYAYSADKTKVLVIDGTAPVYDMGGKYVAPSTDEHWPLGKEVGSFKFLGAVLQKPEATQMGRTHRLPRSTG